MSKNNLNKEFVPFEQALDLKEIGFDGSCFTYYQSNGMFSPLPYFNEGFTLKDLDKAILAPTYSQALKWFRDKHKLLHEIRTYNEGSWLLTIYSISSKTKHGVYNGKRWEFENDENYVDPNSYEEAELACIKKLIEIVKNETNKA